jgi:hypothetical protein
LPPEPFLRFSQRTCPIHYFRPKTHVWGGFVQFRCRTSPIPKTGVGVHTKHEFLPPEPILRFSQRTCPIQYFRSKTHVWGGFAQFRCRTSPIPKMGVGVHTSTSFRHRNHFLVLRNEHAQSTTLGPKLMFGVVLRKFVAARHPFRKWVSGCIQSTSFRHRNHFFVLRNEHAQSTTLGTKLMFGVVSRNFVAARHQFENGCRGAYKHEFLPPEPFLHFSQRTCPIHYFRSKTHVWGGFAQFRCRTSPILKTGVGVHTSTSVRHRNHFFVFRNEHAQSTTLGPKLMFGVVSRNFVTARHLFRKRVSGAYKA